MEKDFFNQFLNKKVKVIFDDAQSIARKEGIFLGFNDNFIFIDTGDKEALPISKIVRIEFSGDEQK